MRLVLQLQWPSGSVADERMIDLPEPMNLKVDLQRLDATLDIVRTYAESMIRTQEQKNARSADSATS